jgi:TRAP-type uncharacterized transport system substrate-binding protein
VLAYYGLSADKIKSFGGTIESALIAGVAGVTDFDVIISELASPANNPESAYWTTLSQKFDLRFLDVPGPLLDQLAADPDLGMKRVIARWGLLRGVDRPIATVGRSGEAVFARDDMPEQAAYDAAKAIDEHRDALKWFIRPYAYDSRTVFENFGVPLHPGAERYYREVGYMAGSAATACSERADGGASDAGADAARAHRAQASSAAQGGSRGCCIGAQRAAHAGAPYAALGVLFLARRRRPRLR